MMASAQPHEVLWPAVQQMAADNGRPQDIRVDAARTHEPLHLPPMGACPQVWVMFLGDQRGGDKAENLQSNNEVLHVCFNHAGTEMALITIAGTCSG